MTTLAQKIHTRPLNAYLVLLLIIFAAATGPIAIRKAQLAGAPSLYIIAVRLILASLVMAPFVLKRHRTQISQLPGKAWLLVITSALFLALNLLLLFFALELTSVLVTGVLRRTTPLWVIGLEVIFLGAVFTRSVWVGLLLSLMGSVLVAVGGSGAIEAGSNPLLGMVVALAGSVSIGLYMLIGRWFSMYLPSLAYSWLVFFGAAIMVSTAVIATGTPITGYSLNAWFWIIIVTIITQFLGHVPINMGLHYFPATYISIVMQMAVVVSAILAFVAFNQIPSVLQVAGSVIIMIGVILVSWK